MGSSKKKKEKAKDFAKAKLKLGKGKQKAANATDASYASKTISLGQQSIGREANPNAPTTKRNLTLSDLLTQLKHYNASVRKDALLGLRELLDNHADIFDDSVPAVVPALARLIGDEEASVRKTLLSVLSWYLPITSPLILRPYQQTLVSFTLSALSHIYPDVRMDALRTLNLLLDVMPEDLALPWLANASSGNSSFGERILEHCLSLLHVRSGSTNTGLRTDISTTSKALILSTLKKLISASLDPSAMDNDRGTSSIPSLSMWQFRQQLRTQRALATFEGRRGSPDKRKAVEVPFEPLSSWPCGNLMMDAAAFDLDDICSAEDFLLPANHASSDQSSINSPALLLEQLLPLLTAAFLDTAPTAFAPATAVASTSANTTTDAASKTALSVVKIIVHLLQARIGTARVTDAAALPASIAQGLIRLLSHIAAYFPLSTEVVQHDKSAASVRQELNIAFCEFTAYLALMTKSGAHHKGKSTAKTPLSHHLQATRSYLREVLSVPDVRTVQVFGSQFDAHVYARVVPVLGVLLDTSGDADSGDLWQSIVSHFASCSSGSLLKKFAFRTVAAILEAQLQPDYIGGFDAFTSVDNSLSACAAWYAALPRYLWELGDKDPATAALILQHLHTGLLAGCIGPDETLQLARHLEPYFCSLHPTRGEIYGPFAECSDISVQEAALGVVTLMRQSVDAEGNALAIAAEKAVKRATDTGLVDEWERISSRVVVHVA